MDNARLILFADSDCELSVRLIDVAGEPINGAAVNVTLYKDRKRNKEVSGETWPLLMNYVPASAGQYTLELSESLDTNVNQVLSLLGRVTTTDGKRLKFSRDVSVAEA